LTRKLPGAYDLAAIAWINIVFGKADPRIEVVMLLAKLFSFSLMLGSLLLPMLANASSANAAPQYSTSSSDPYERAAAEMQEALAVIENRLATASATRDPDKDSELQRQISRYVMLHRQLSDNAGKHQIQPPNLDRLRAICAGLESKVLPKNLFDELDGLRKEQKRTIKEYKMAEYLRDRQAKRIKAGLLLKMMKASVEIFAYAPVGIGAGVAGSLAGKVAGLISGINDFVMNQVIDSDPNPRSPFDLKTQNEHLRRFYRDNREDIDRKMGAWVRRRYYDSGKVKNDKEYTDLVKSDSDARSAYLTALHRIIMEALVKRKELLVDLAKKQQAEIDRLRKDPRYLNAKPNLEKYRAICSLILGLPPWKPTGKPPQKPPKKPGPGVIEFSRDEYTAPENSGQVKVQVVRTGGSHGALWVMAETAPDSAGAWDDYSPAPARLDWDDGDASPKEFTIYLRDDEVREAKEQLILKLKAPPGVKLGAKSTARLVIIDNDKPGARTPEPSKPLVCRSLSITPQKAVGKPGQRMDFASVFKVTALMSDQSQRQVTSDPGLTWLPGPSINFPRKSKFNRWIKVEARYMDCSAGARIEVEYPAWSEAMSDEDDIGARGQKPPLDIKRWYALCDKKDGSVAFANNYSATRHHIMKDGFIGPRNAKKWINDNCPSWKCDPDRGNCVAKPRRAPAASKGYYALCRKKDGQVVVSKSYNAAQHHIMGGPFLSKGDARQFVNGKCPRWLCDDRGACSKEPQKARAGKGYYVVCNLSQGRVEFRKRPKPGSTQIMGGPFRQHSGALEWAKANCPSGRCDSQGRCSSAPAMGGKWNVVCSRKNGQAYITEDYNPARNHIWQQRLRSRSDAELWLAQNCPSGRCDQNGRCQSGPPAPTSAGRGNLKVVCVRATGRIGVTKHYNAAQHGLWQGGFSTLEEASQYARRKCPALRCNILGECISLEDWSEQEKQLAELRRKHQREREQLRQQMQQEEAQSQRQQMMRHQENCQRLNAQIDNACRAGNQMGVAAMMMQAATIPGCTVNPAYFSNCQRNTTMPPRASRPPSQPSPPTANRPPTRQPTPSQPGTRRPDNRRAQKEIFCKRYAQTAVSQVGRYNARNCGKSKTRRWNPKYEAHFNWCMDVKEGDANYETKNRENFLRNSCR
jgi:hypothetical protein